MKKIAALFCACNILAGIAIMQAQNNMGVGVLNPHPSSLLELSANDKGFLVPRMDSVSRNSITAPARGLLVYDTDYDDFWYFDGIIWRRAVGPQGAAGVAGPPGPLVAGTFGQTLHHDGATWVANSLLYNDGTNIGVGSTSPQTLLTVFGGKATFSRDGIYECCGNDATVVIGENPSVSNNRASISFHNSGESEGTLRLIQNAVSGVNTVARRLQLFDNQSQGLGLEFTGGLFYGSGNSRTETRNNAGLQGDAGAQSGFFQTENPVNYPAGATGWWHLIDTRHGNNANNYALQISGSFFDQRLYFRKTNNDPATPWTELLTTATPIISQVVSQRIELRQGPGTGCDNCWHTTKHSNDFAMTGISIYASDRLDGDVRTQGQEVGFLNNAVFGWYGRYGITTENGTANTDDNGVDNTEHFASCPANYIATGFEAYATSRLDGRLKLRCTALKAGYTTTDNTGNGGTAGVESAMSYPHNNGTDDVQHGAFCPAGTWLNGIRIYASDRLDGRMRAYCTAIR